MSIQTSPFQKVREVLPRASEQIAREEGVKHVKDDQFRMRNEWNHGFLCVVNCGDKSGSGSFTKDLFFHCHQCGAKHDVFDWISRLRGTDPWTECKRLAERLQIDIQTRRLPRGRSMPKRMTKDLLDAATVELLEADGAADARKFLQGRGLYAPQALASLGVGFLRGYIVFAQFGPKGEILERYRAYVPGGQPPWFWFGAGTGGPGVWPAHRHPGENDKILLLEGEWDVLTALIRLRMHGQGWTPCTFTSGAGAHPPAHVIPKWFADREVHLAYDNDTFQGPDYRNYTAVAKPGKKLENALKAMHARLGNVVERVIPMLEELGCSVAVRKCPIDPTEQWGADFRDWYDKGGRDFEADWTAYRDLPPLRSNVTEIAFDEVFQHVGSRIKTVAQVATLSDDDVIIPAQMSLDCPMGSAPACASCPAVRIFPDRLIDMRDFPEFAARALHPEVEKNYVLKNIVRQPRGCPGASVTPIRGESKSGSIWYAIRPATNQEEEANRTILVISDEPPSLTGNVELIGDVYYEPDLNRAFIRADKIRSLDRTEVDLRPHLAEFMTHLPHSAIRTDAIDDYFEERWRDLMANVTRIYGRRELSIAHDLMMHSVTDLFLQRETAQRGWVDLTIFGNTRSGKTATFDALMKFHGLGVIHSAVSNVSRAGLVMGTDSKGLLRPGLFPRCHRKALVLDEWHLLVRSLKNGGNPAGWIQTARDSGYADSAKISGNRKLPTKVRFATIANWTNGARRHHQFDCQHLVDLYDTPESIARLDFAIAVHDEPTETEIPKVEQFWTAERCRILIMRAWAMTADQVTFEDGCYETARLQVEEWRGRYETEVIPLYTVEEKHLSILRIAVACANICFSHPEGKPQECLVRKAHVLWAIEWLKWTWINNGYEQFSAAEAQRESLPNQFIAERLLTVGLGIDDFISVRNVLGDLFGGFTYNELPVVTGKDLNEANRWLAQARKANLFKIARVNTFGSGKRYVPTRGCSELLQAIIRIADEEPETYVGRYRALSNWFNTDAANQKKPYGLEAISGSDGSKVPF